jgi:tetratricopeptide (TPR) repeat protein
LEAGIDASGGGGDDQLDGPLLPRFWTAGESKGEASIEMASAALLTGSEEIAAMLPQISSRRDKWTSGEGKPDRKDMNLLLAEGYLRMGDGANARTAGDALLAEFPDSETAMRLIGMADSLNRAWTHWNSMLDAALAKHPTDHDLLSGKAWAEQAQGDFAGARKTLRQVLDAGQATGNDYNNYSWNALFQDKVDADAIQAALQANMLSKNSSFADLHTLSCLYAAQGKTTEAKQVLFEAMAAANLGQPNSSAWFAFGAIFEQYGVLDAAIAAYKKVERPEGPITPTDTYVLAQNHLKALHAGE